MGWASGLQAGINLGEKIRQGQIQGALADEAKKYTPTEGAYGDMSANIEQVRALQAQNPDQAAQYEPAIAELQRRQGLTAPDYSVASGPQNYATMQEAQQAAAPLRTAGLANVYRGYGEVGQAEELTARAQQQQLALTQEQRAAEGFKTSQEAAGLQIRRSKREEDTEKKILDVDKEAGEFLTKRLTDSEGVVRPAGTDDMIAQIQHRAMLLQKGGLGREATAALKDWQGVAVNAIQLTTAQRNDDLGRVATALAAGDLKPAQAFYDKYVLDGAKVTGMQTDPKTGAITVSRVRDDGVKLPDTKINSVNEMLATLNSFKDPLSLYNYSQNEFKNNLQTRQVAAAEKTANATASLSNERLTTVKEDRENRSKAGDIAAEFEGLSSEEKAGSKGVGLIRQFNMANAKAGGQISLGAQQRPGQTMTDVEKANLTEYYKWENDDRNARLPQAEKDKKATRMGVYQFVNPTANTVDSGLGSNPYANTSATPKQGDVKQQGIQTTAPKLTSMNTRLLGRAGNMGYNVELPDGTTRVMEKDELEDLGYRFPSR